MLLEVKLKMLITTIKEFEKIQTQLEVEDETTYRCPSSILRHLKLIGAIPYHL